MKLIQTFRNAEERQQADIYQMDASGFAVFVFEPGHEDAREGFVFDSEADARAFAIRKIGGRPVGA